jgi:hypothetical protein
MKTGDDLGIYQEKVCFLTPDFRLLMHLRDVSYRAKKEETKGSKEARKGVLLYQMHYYDMEYITCSFLSFFCCFLEDTWLHAFPVVKHSNIQRSKETL